MLPAQLQRSLPAARGRAKASFEELVERLGAVPGMREVTAMDYMAVLDSQRHFPDPVAHSSVVRVAYFLDDGPARPGAPGGAGPGPRGAGAPVECFGVVAFGPEAEGPPTCAHGGLLALVLDDLTGLCNIVHGTGGFTVGLNVRYRGFVPLGEAHFLHARVEERSDRKTVLRGEILAQDGAVRTAGEGIFVQLTPEQRELGLAALRAKGVTLSKL